MNSMELKFLIDVGVGKGIEKYLHAEGYDIKAVRDIDPCLEDEKIILTVSKTVFVFSRMINSELEK
ncbi:MAG: hypothetical protein V2J08_00350 [Desulfotignum sp.]|jgi:hypothetical protein|nr:hypothetical protein [Desulfotignum sp.]